MSAERRREGIRAQLRQVRHWFHPYRVDRHALVHDTAALLDLRFPDLGHQTVVPGSVWACSLVRDEADIIDQTLDHLLRQGVDHVLIADNGSTDGTLELLRGRSAADPRVHLVVDRKGTFYHGAKMTRLAQVAWFAGADWVVPFDADEWWFAVGMTVAEYLTGSSASQVSAETFNAVPVPSEAALASRTFLLSSRPTSWRKVAFRTHPLARVEFGNHVIGRVGPRENGLYIAHLAYRSEAHLRRKLLRGGEAAVENRMGWKIGLHWWWGAQLSDPEFADVWRTITTGRPDHRIDWEGMPGHREVDLDAWDEWRGPLDTPTDIPG